MRRIFTSAAIAVLTLTGVAQAESPKLKGDYAVTGEAACLGTTDPAGFDLVTLKPVNVNSAFTTSFSVQGVRKFNGDGTGSMKGRVVTILKTPSTSGAAPIDIQYDFTYAVNNDGGFTSDLVPGTFKGKYLAGIRKDQEFVLNTLHFEGLISNDASVLTMAQAWADVETHTFTVCAPTPTLNCDTRFQICHRSRVLTWMGSSKKN
jgi:hypothetical protein